LAYLRDEITAPGSEDWTARALSWAGDAKLGAAFRRWRLSDYPTPLWLICETRRGSPSFSLLEE
jgi:hypothetical protein